MTPRVALVLAPLLAACAATAGHGSSSSASCDDDPWALAAEDEGAGPAVLYWADRPGLLEEAPPEVELPEGFVEATDVSESLWVGTLRRRGGELFLPGPLGGRRCTPWTLEAEGEDRGWIVSEPFDRSGRAVRAAYRYAFRQRLTGFVDEETPARSRTIEQVSFDVEGPMLRVEGHDGAVASTEAVLGCNASYHFVHADDDHLRAVPAAHPGAVRAYDRATALAFHLDGRACLER